MKKCSVPHCGWEAHPLYFHPVYDQLCENHYVDLAWLLMYTQGKKKLPEYPLPGREQESNPYYLANSSVEKANDKKNLPKNTQTLMDLGYKLPDIPTSSRDRDYLIQLSL